LSLIKLIEETANDITQVEKEFDIYASCSAKSGMDSPKLSELKLKIKNGQLDPDPCEKAANIFKCGVDSNSAAMTTFVSGASAQYSKDSLVYNYENILYFLLNNYYY
jgi:hypothetical protein